MGQSLQHLKLLLEQLLFRMVLKTTLVQCVFTAKCESTNCTKALVIGHAGGLVSRDPQHGFPFAFPAKQGSQGTKPQKIGPGAA